MLSSRTAVASIGLALSLALPTAAAADASLDPASGEPHPPRAAGITANGRSIVFFDPISGVSLGGSTDRDGSFLDADYSLVLGAVFYVRHMDGEDVIMRSQLRGSGPAGPMARGRRVAVSPDGRFLAYSYDPDGPARGSMVETIAVRNLESGVERVYASPPVPDTSEEPPIDLEELVINDLAISPDSKRLAFDYIGGGEVFILDLDADADLADAEPLSAVPGAHSPAWLDRITLAVIDIDGVVKSVFVDGDDVGTPYDLPGYAEALDADDQGRLMVKVDLGQADPQGRSFFALVNEDGEDEQYIVEPYVTVVW